MTDPLSDMFTQIRNALSAGKESLEVPFSKMKFDIAKILEREGFIQSAELRGRKVRKGIELVLKYGEGKIPAISEIVSISKPGQRIYAGAFKVHAIKRGAGIAILTTSRGIMTDKEAKKQNVGGEVLCRVL